MTEFNNALAAEDIDQANDPVFVEEQAHLSATHAKLRELAESLTAELERNRAAAAEDKRTMGEELTASFATDSDAMETYADFAAMNRIIDGYNHTEEANTEALEKIALLLREPYFAKVSLRFKPGAPCKDLYIGSTGIADENYKRLVVDWRSPVAEVYYNQDNGATSYEANGRTINVNLEVRRQFDIEKDRLNAYFDTTVAIQDALLLSSLSKQRTSQMKAITATIQKEQNQVVRHEDVPVLLVNGIAGSGKTSVLMQRIAYLFYQNRGKLDPTEVFLISPNPLFSRYISGVLPDLGEKNPETLTWSEFAGGLMPEGRVAGKMDTPIELLWKADEAVATLSLGARDFKDIVYNGLRFASAAQILQIAQRHENIAVGPHLITLIREELRKRVVSRLKQMSHRESVHDAILELPTDEQLRLFSETIAPQTEEESTAFALTYLNDKYAPVLEAVERDEWLRIDRLGMRALGVESLSPTLWLYFKIALTGMGNPYAKYVMIDEVQDYTASQLAVLGRYFRRANFLLLGDENQAIKPETVTFEEARQVLERMRGSVEECRLLTSYRSTPGITALFASLMPGSTGMNVTSIQREEAKPVVRAYANEKDYAAALRETVQEAARESTDGNGLTAIVVPWKHEAEKLQAYVGGGAPALLTNEDTLPASGLIMLPLDLAKGLEFDHVILPDASKRLFGTDDRITHNRLYTTISRATKKVTILARGEITPLLASFAE